MKQLKNLKSIVLAITVGASTWSCVNNDEFELPLIEIKTVDLETSAATVEDYVPGKYVKLHGNVSVESGRSYFVFKDGTKVQIFAFPEVVETLSDEQKQKLLTQGQELTVTGEFKNYKLKNGTVVKEIVYSSVDDLVFGETPGGVTPGGGEVAPVTGKVFDFENLSGEPSNNYGNTGTLSATDGTVLTYEGRTDLGEYEISGKGLMIQKDKGHIIMTFATDVKKVKFAYKAAYSSTSDRKIVIYKGDEASTEKLAEKVFASTEQGEFEFNLDGAKKITIKAEGKQVVIDNISWSEENNVTPTPPATGEVLEASNLTAADYNVNDKVKIHGTISIEDKKSYFVFRDGTKVRIFAYTADWDNVSADAKTKLNTEGQEVTVSGVFKNIKEEKGLQFKVDADLVFEASPNNGGGSTTEVTGVIDFENLDIKDSHENTYELDDGNIVVKYKGAITTGYKINEKGLRMKKAHGEFIEITFKAGIKKISFKYKRFYTSDERSFVFSVGGDDSLGETVNFNNQTVNTFEKTLNKEGETVVKIAANSNYIMLDDITWTR